MKKIIPFMMLATFLCGCNTNKDKQEGIKEFGRTRYELGKVDAELKDKTCWLGSIDPVWKKTHFFSETDTTKAKIISSMYKNLSYKERKSYIELLIQMVDSLEGVQYNLATKSDSLAKKYKLNY